MNKEPLETPDVLCVAKQNLRALCKWAMDNDKCWDAECDCDLCPVSVLLNLIAEEEEDPAKTEDE